MHCVVASKPDYLFIHFFVYLFTRILEIKQKILKIYEIRKMLCSGCHSSMRQGMIEPLTFWKAVRCSHQLTIGEPGRLLSSYVTYEHKYSYA